MFQQFSYTVCGHIEMFPVLLEFTRLPAGEPAGDGAFCGVDVKLMGLPRGFETNMARVTTAIRNLGFPPLSDLSLVVDAYRAATACSGNSLTLAPDEPLSESLVSDSLIDLRPLDCALAAGILVASGELSVGDLKGRVFAGSMTSRGVVVGDEKLNPAITCVANNGFDLVGPEHLKAVTRSTNHRGDNGHTYIGEAVVETGNPPLSGVTTKSTYKDEATQRLGGGAR